MYGGIFYLNKSDLKRKIEILVMKAIRIISKKKLSDKVKNEVLLKTLELPKLEVLIKRQMLLEMLKWGPKRENVFEPMNTKTRGNSKNKLRPIGNSFLGNMKDVWNDFGHMIKSSSKESLKNDIKKLIK